MKNINKVLLTYTYPSGRKGEPSIEVGFYIDSRLDRYGNVLRKLNVADNFGDMKIIPYSGKTLMISVKTSIRTTSVRRATRQDLVKYKEAYTMFLDSLDKTERKEFEEKTYLFLEEVPPTETKKDKTE